MSSHSAPTRRSHLALGAALLGCSLVAAEADASGLAGTTLQSLSSQMSISSSSATRSRSWSKSGPLTSWDYFSAQSANANVACDFHYYTTAELGGFSPPRVQVRQSFNAASTGAGSTWGSGSGSFTLTFATRVRFSEAEASLNSPWDNPTWTVGGASITTNAEFAAGTYTFNWSFSDYSYPGVHWYGVFAYFFEAPSGGGGGVPLPGAAGLAACGLLAAARRRRR